MEVYLNQDIKKFIIIDDEIVIINKYKLIEFNLSDFSIRNFYNFKVEITSFAVTNLNLAIGLQSGKIYLFVKNSFLIYDFQISNHSIISLNFDLIHQTLISADMLGNFYFLNIKTMNIYKK